MIVEICVDTTRGTQIARDEGADRVELCRDLWCGGLTPTLSAVVESLEVTPRLGVQVLVRSRPGNFVFTRDEVQGMCASMKEICNATAGAAPEHLGFVVGSVSLAGRIDSDAVARFRDAADGHSVAFHRAFDATADHTAALEGLVSLGIVRVLTTGGTTGKADIAGLRSLIHQADGRIAILASGGLRAHNVAQIVEQVGAHEVHMRAPLRQSVQGGPPEGTDPTEVAHIVAALRPPLG
ncbi:MAG: copper homeostasis protein CutC [Ancrocorticia sp.]|nr:copper homeostasis protein CutC [Ancrocorticia sp.]MCI2193944.1 copper homeostasis protein CutC [Ancrocorticia sp.]MCI2198577.1 copper homeostasis protein CutC [Ancrocorticia sp.]